MKHKSIRRNYILNASYQVLVLLIPLITTPYLARVLGADGTGKYSFVESIVSYFVLFATMGVTTYGQREISYVRDDERKRSHVFWETKIFEIITAIGALIIYIAFALTREDKTLYLAVAFNIIAVIADVTWFFQGMEEFGKIVFRNTSIKLINIVYIFIFIKTKNDLVWYLLGTSIFIFIGNVSLWFSLSKYINAPNLREIRPFRNVSIILSLFIPTIAVQIYTVLDKTMIGVITKDSYENGYYEQAIKVSKVALSIITALGTVMIPRIGYHYERKEKEIVLKYMYRGYRFVWLLGIPLCFGLIGISKNFVPWFYGDGYEDVIVLLEILSFLILAIGINNVTGMQYLIPTKRQSLFTRSVLIGAGVNFILNIFLIYYLKSVGAAIASVVAETVIAIFQLWLVRNEISIKNIITSSHHYLVAGGVMLIFLRFLENILTASIIHTVLMITSGAIVYFFVLFFEKDNFFLENISSIITNITKLKK